MPVLAGFGLGFAVILLFLSLFNYIIDAYLPVAASALAASTVVRSAFGAGFPVSAHYLALTYCHPGSLCLSGTRVSARTSCDMRGYVASMKYNGKFTDAYLLRLALREPDVRSIGSSDRVYRFGSLHTFTRSSPLCVREVRGGYPKT